MDNQSGRHWRPLVDTARAVQFTYSGDRGWRNARRGSDYYNEGMLVWLDADILIRQKSGGKLSLDDFLRKFHGGENGSPVVKPYELDEIVATLNEVVPYDWKGFFEERVYRVADHAPMGGITNGGWKLAYTDKTNVMGELYTNLHGLDNLFYSIGIITDNGGGIRDIIPDSPAGKVGLAPGMSIESIGGEKFSLAGLHKAITDAKGKTAPIVLTVSDSGFEETYNLDYHGGELYPHLVRDTAKPDLLSDVVKSR
jgi:predicted metalloprotease with PDZ domain